MREFIIRNGWLVNEGQTFRGSLHIRNEFIHRIYRDEVPLEAMHLPFVDASGKHLLPGIIDDQVHFREPGLTHKANLFSESRAAVAGGITSFMDMPNTQPQTISQFLLEEKNAIASVRSLANFSFYLGATNDNIAEIVKTDPRTICGIKVFMGASTGNMLVDNPKSLAAIFEQSPTLVAVHSEHEPTIRANAESFKQQYGERIPIHLHPQVRSEEACLRSTNLAIELAQRYGTKLHVLHLSTEKETALFSRQPLAEKKITAEVCIHHLWFSDQDYAGKGSLIKWNPAIKTPADREGLFLALLEDRLDVVATDHSPHTWEEKGKTYFQCPSGGPLVQHSLPAMLEFHLQGRISLGDVVRKMAHAPAELFHVDRRGFIREGYFADLVLVDMNKPWSVNKNNILYKCGWSPFEGTRFGSSVTHTWVNGNLVFENGRFNEDHKGMRLRFNR